VPADSSDISTRLDSISAAVDVVTKRGVLPVLSALAHGPLRHNDLARATSMDNKQLARALDHAQRGNLIDRQVYTDRTPVQVRYLLTRRGEELVVALDVLASSWDTPV
jgi:DNA-binding HxlR family transcriptional regulator